MLIDFAGRDTVFCMAEMLQAAADLNAGDQVLLVLVVSPIRLDGWVKRMGCEIKSGFR